MLDSVFATIFLIDSLGDKCKVSARHAAKRVYFTPRTLSFFSVWMTETCFFFLHLDALLMWLFLFSFFHGEDVWHDLWPEQIIPQYRAIIEQQGRLCVWEVSRWFKWYTFMIYKESSWRENCLL